MTIREPHSGDLEKAADLRLHVLVMNHRRDPLGPLVRSLEGAGYAVTETQALADTYRWLGKGRPAVVVLDPLLLKAGGVEIELLEGMQRADDPMPVILLVDDVDLLTQARLDTVPLRDFLLKASAVTEGVHRVELALANKSRMLALQRRAAELEGQVTLDFKTGLSSERHFKKVLQMEFKRAQRHRTPLSLLLIDVDDFKSVNDTTEYAFGDQVLHQVADALKRNTRESDHAARLGGDEFVLLLPHTTPAEAVQTAIRVRKMISDMVVKSDFYSRRVTVSIGIDTFDGRSSASAEELGRNANRALQEAKRRGKNQVWLHAEVNEGRQEKEGHGAPTH